MDENGRLFLLQEQLNFINLSIVENTSKCITKITERFLRLIMEKNDTHLM